MRLSGGQVESLFDLGLPVEVRELPGDLAALDRLLTDPALLEPVERGWGQAARGHGRPTIPMTVFIRLMIIKQRSGWGYETLVREVSDSLHLRRFCLIALTERVADESTHSRRRSCTPLAGCGVQLESSELPAITSPISPRTFGEGDDAGLNCMVKLSGVGALVGDVADERRRREEFGGELLLFRGVRADRGDRRSGPHVACVKVWLRGRCQAHDEVGASGGGADVLRDVRLEVREAFP
jgi:hypothetical protein